MSRLASNQLNIKMRLERSFANDLRKIYVNEANYVAELAKNNIVPDKFKNQEKLERAIKNHLKRVRSQMTESEFTTRAFNAYELVMVNKIYKDCVNSFNKLAQTAKLKGNKVNDQLSFNDKEIIALGRVCFEEDSKTWLSYMLMLIPIRVNIVSNVQTQEVYEGQRQIAALEDENETDDYETISPEAAGSSVAIGTIAGLYFLTGTKTWKSIFGATTRDAHAAADGQTVKITDPFIINGQPMMYPGDSRNATPDNFMNCHCSVKYN